MTNALATRRVRLKVPGQQELVEVALFSSFSLSLTGELEHMVLYSFFFLSFFLSIVIFPLIQLGLCESSNVDGCETTVLEHVLEKRNSSCPLLLLLTSSEGHAAPASNETNERTEPPLGGLPNFFIITVKNYTSKLFEPK